MIKRTVSAGSGEFIVEFNCTSAQEARRICDLVDLHKRILSDWEDDRPRFARGTMDSMGKLSCAARPK